jgi:predicted RNA-binding Zn ribbon-like protein
MASASERAARPAAAAAAAAIDPLRRGTEPLVERVFELDTGWLCLDFVNTRSLTSGDLLASYADLVAFAHQSGLVSRADADYLGAEAERDQSAAEGVLRRALNLREALRGLFSALAAGRAPASTDLAILNADLENSLPHARVLPTHHPKGGYAWGWHGRNMDAPIWPVSRSAADLLTDDQARQRLRECGAPDCAWLFVDTSKNRTRQWCSMRSCGNREKARRHYQRLRARRPGTSAAAASAADAGQRAAAPRGRRPGRRSAATPVDGASATAG